MTTNVGTTTTYFVGTHYEVTGSEITKYYYAGSQRIAMRKNGTLNYLIGDHLGSTSLVTDASGSIINQTQYKAWGEERYSSGTKQTGYGYTGQYSYAADFGLHFYNARWYDSSLGRFAQADTIVPGGVQGYDRYAYTYNNPLKYTDPSGHEPGNHCDRGYCDRAGNIIMAFDPTKANEEIPAEDLQKEFLHAALRHQSDLPEGMSVRLFLAMAAAEKGVCSNWSQVHDPCNPGNADGLLQITNEDFRLKSQYPYNDTYGGYEGIVLDAIAYLNEISDNFHRQGIDDNFTEIASSASVKLLLYWNGGGNPMLTYAGGVRNEDNEVIKGNQNYLADVAKYLENSPFGPQYSDSALASNLRVAQNIVDLRVPVVREAGILDGSIIP